MLRSYLLPGLLIVVAGCGSRDQRPASDADVDHQATRVASVEGFSTPESVTWDAAGGHWFVSNIVGGPSAKDGNGFISRLTADGQIDSLHFIAGGRDGVTLNGPKGLKLVGDTLWVADIDALRGFNRLTGAPVATVEIGDQAKFLNDVATAPDGTIYITDTGIHIDTAVTHPGPDRIFAVAGRTVSVAAEGDWLLRPNGITWDAAANRFIVAPFGGSPILGWSPGSSSADTLGEGPGGQDGVELLDGAPLISSWADSTVFTIQDGASRVVVSGVGSPADIGLDPSRRLLAVPRFSANTVEFWQLPGGGAQASR